jgi:hypothetical protein
VTRARQHLVATTHAWSDLIKPRAVSPYLTVLEGFADEPLHEPIPPSNPLLGEGGGFPWPAPRDEAQWLVRPEAAEAVRAAQARPDRPMSRVVLLDEAAEVARWDAGGRPAARRGTPAPRTGWPPLLPPYWSATSLIAHERRRRSSVADLAASDAVTATPGGARRRESSMPGWSAADATTDAAAAGPRRGAP